MAKKSTVSTQAADSENTTLAGVCKNNPDLRDHCGSGLDAMKKTDRKYIKVPKTSLIGATLDLDTACKKSHPHSNRWDYALEYAGDTFFIEIHPGATSEIDCVIAKVDFIRKWINDNAPEINALPKKEPGARQFYWVSSGRTDLRISSGSRQARQLALKHIRNVGSIWDFAKIFKSR